MFTKDNASAIAKKGGGRPKGSSYVALCQAWSEEKGGSWDILFAWAKGREGKKMVNKALRKFAIDRILAYGYGKPRESIDIGSSDGSLAGLARAFIRGGVSGVSGGGLRPAGKILDGSGGDQPVAETDGDRPVDKRP